MMDWRERVERVIRSGLPPRVSLPGEADHLGIPELGFRPRVAEPELITRVGGLSSMRFSLLPATLACLLLLLGPVLSLAPPCRMFRLLLELDWDISPWSSLCSWGPARP